MLKNKIIAVQSGNKCILENLIIQFEPLILKYAYRLHNEDGYQEMALMFIELLKKLPIFSLKNTSDGAIINYIHSSMYHDYISYSKKRRQQQAFEVSVSEFPEIGQAFEYDNFEDILEISPLKDREKNVLRKIYRDGYSAAEIAKQENISRQSVNQTKTRALRKLRDAIKL